MRTGAGSAARFRRIQTAHEDDEPPFDEEDEMADEDVDVDADSDGYGENGDFQDPSDEHAGRQRARAAGKQARSAKHPRMHAGNAGKACAGRPHGTARGQRA